MSIDHNFYFVFPAGVVPSPEIQISSLQRHGFTLEPSGGYAFMVEDDQVLQMESDEGPCSARDLIEAGPRLLPLMQLWEGRGESWFNLGTVLTDGHYVTFIFMTHRNLSRMIEHTGGVPGGVSRMFAAFANETGAEYAVMSIESNAGVAEIVAAHDHPQRFAHLASHHTGLVYDRSMDPGSTVPLLYFE